VVNRPEIFQNSLIERTPKAAFGALINLSIKHSRPFSSDLETDKEARKLSKVIFEILKISTILHLPLVSRV